MEISSLGRYVHRIAYSTVPTIRLTGAPPNDWNDDAEIETAFPGYGVLKDEIWIQLNSPKDFATVQLKLKKTPPESTPNAHAGDDYFVYGVARFVAHMTSISPPKTERETIMAI